MRTAVIVALTLCLAGCSSGWYIQNSKQLPMTVQVIPDKDGTCGFLMKRPNMPGEIHATADNCPARR